MGRLPKCKHCGQTITNKEEAYYDGTSYYCNKEHYDACIIKMNKVSNLCGHCGTVVYNESCVQKYNRKFCSDLCVTKFEKDEKNIYEVLLGYIHYNLRNSNSPDYIIIQQQVDHYVSKYKMKYPAMLLTCKYWHEVLGKTWNEDYHLGQIFPYYYAEAEAYYKQKKKVWENLKNSQEEEPEVRKVTANTNRLRYKIHVDDISKL